jgi:RNA polymerase sigma factor (sigma-70 family)
VAVNPESISQLYQRYRRTLARAAARIVKPLDVEDVVQETYLRVFQAAQKQPIRHPRAFMLTTVRHIALNLVTRADALNHADDVPCDAPDSLRGTAAADCQVLAEAEEEFLILCRAVRELAPQCRKAFILKRVYGLSQREVAAEMEVSEGTVEKHLARALVACHRYMAANGYARDLPATSRGHR